MRLRNLFLLIGLSLASLSAMGQATSLTIDNQTPGWLSSKINYGDQQTLQNLKLTGYINADDLKFIGEMMQKHSLTGYIDLEDVNIIGSTSTDDNVMPENAFNINWSQSFPDTVKISHIKFPLSLEKSQACLSNYIKVDTITVGGENMQTIHGDYFYTTTYPSSGDGRKFNTRVKHLILREGVIELASGAFCCYASGSFKEFKDICIFKSIIFPTSLKKIGGSAFWESFALKSFRLPNHIEEIGVRAFLDSGFNPDTLYVPEKITKLNTRAFNIPKVVILSENVEKIDNTYLTNGGADIANHWSSNNIKIIVKATTPPEVICGSSIYILNKATVYVPKSSITSYMNTRVWNNALAILPIPTDVTSIILTGTTSMKVGQTAQLEAVAYPLDADDRSLLWESSNNDIATVTQNGTVTALAQGEVKIKVSSISNPSVFKECTISIIQPVVGISLNKTEMNLKVGETNQLNVSIFPNNATNKEVIWKSENEKIATVSQNGMVQALSPGETIIYVNSTEDESIQSQCSVTVTQPVSSITLDESTILLKSIGETKQLTATVYPSDASNKTINWYSSNTNVCIVSPRGLVTAVGEGNSVIVATTEDGGYTATCVVTVKFGTVEPIELNKTELILHVGENEQLSVISIPEELVGKNINWSSSDESVAIVDKNGLVQAKSTGSAKVIAMIGDNYATCQVTVNKNAQSIAWNQNFDDVKEGDVITLTASASSGLPVSYEIEKGESLASISGDVLTFIKAGDIKVTAKQPGNDEFEPAETVSKSIIIASGIEDVIADNNGRYIVHNLQGCLILDTDDIEKVNSLEHGIYIINGVKVVK